jgi:uncharacterized protein YjcR
MPRSASVEARDFRVWSYGKSVGWQATAAEIAEATGISSSAVRSICKRRKWKCLRDPAGDRSGNFSAEPSPIDMEMRHV